MQLITRIDFKKGKLYHLLRFVSLLILISQAACSPADNDAVPRDNIVIRQADGKDTVMIGILTLRAGEFDISKPGERDSRCFI